MMNLQSPELVGRKQSWTLSLLALTFCCTLALGLAPVQEAKATPGQGITSEPLALGGLAEPIRTKLKADSFSGFDNGVPVMDLVAIRFTVAPGGYFGWHRHGGPVWVIVMEGTLTLYDPEIPGCARVFPAGSAFLDEGEHVHNARNEGGVPVVIHTTFMLPDGAPVRDDADAPDPSVCTLRPL